MRRQQRKNHNDGRLYRWDVPSNALSHALRDFIEVCGATGLSPLTVRHRYRATARFIRWAEERSLTDPREITLPILERYQRHLYHYRKPNGEPLSFSSQHTELVPLKAYFAWLTRNHIILYNPASELVLPKVIRNIARYVLSVEDVETILAMPDLTTLIGRRDRAMLEVLYSSAIRRAELMRLLIYDVDTTKGTLLVREGKGRKDRIVPLGARACGWVKRYVNDVRPQFVTGRDDGALFLTYHGDSFTHYALGDTVKDYIRRSGVPVKGSCHLFRHACATHMLENGADTRFIQALLGHASLATTQVYTHVALTKLKEIHTATHPAKGNHIETTRTPMRDAATTTEREALLDAVAAEVDDDDESPSSSLYRRPYYPRPGRRGPRKKDASVDTDEHA